MKYTIMPHRIPTTFGDHMRIVDIAQLFKLMMVYMICIYDIIHFFSPSWL